MPPGAQASQTHRVIASLLSADVDVVCNEIRRLAPGTTAEVRLDALWPTPPEPEAAADALDQILLAAQDPPVPLVFTLRPASHGGLYHGPEDVRLNLLVAASRVAQGAAMADIEVDRLVPAVAAALQADAHPWIASRHAPVPPPCKSDGMRDLIELFDAQPALEKYAFPCGSFADALRALELARAHATRHGRPALTPLGGGPELRALLALVGNHATYGHPEGLGPAASGQPALQDIRATWNHWGLQAEDLAASERELRPWLAVLGHPVGHSLSPRIHNASLRHLGRPERFAALDVPASAAALRLALLVAGRNGLTGASVTAPHKVDAARIAESDAIARAVGAANCLRFVGERIEATNTDATALKRILAQHLDANAPCIVVGAGGAARAAIWAATELGAVVQFTSRDPERAAAVAQATGAKWTPWERRDRLSGQAWVQATPVGAPGDPAPIAANQLRGRPLCVELAYGQQPTAFEANARDAGATVVDGRTFLVEQALDATTYWFGEPGDPQAMRDALRPARSGPGPRRAAAEAATA